MMCTHRIQVLDAVADPDFSDSEDRWGYTDRRVWVIDGASGLGASSLRLGQGSDAAWLAELASDLLVETSELPLESALKVVCREINGAFRGLTRDQVVPDESVPSASFLALEFNDDSWSWVSAGDCSAYAERGLVVPPDARLTRLDQGVLDLIRSGHVRGDPIVEDLLRANRMLANSLGGYPALKPGCDSSVFRSGHEGLTGDVQLLIATDGFSRLVDTIGRYSPSEIVSVASRVTLRGLIAELRRHEESTTGDTASVALKQHDDATAVLVRAERA